MRLDPSDRGGRRPDCALSGRANGGREATGREPDGLSFGRGSRPGARSFASPPVRGPSTGAHFVKTETMARQNAGRSSGKRDVIRFPSTTHSLSTQSAPAFRQSSRTLAYEVIRRPFTIPALIGTHAAWQIAATTLRPSSIERTTTFPPPSVMGGPARTAVKSLAQRSRPRDSTKINMRGDGLGPRRGRIR